jgi:ribosomal protein S18 acetylase RimI-like enzyme
VVRPLEWRDLDDLREMYYHLYEERASGDFVGIPLFDRRPSIADEVAWFQGHFRAVLEGHEIFLVAEIGGHAVGSCTIGGGRFGPASEESHVGTLGILVHSRHRGKGVGSALLERALSEARSKYELVYLQVFSENARARELYRRFGFTGCGHQPRAVKRGGRYLDKDEMVLDLAEHPMASDANR